MVNHRLEDFFRVLKPELGAKPTRGRLYVPRLESVRVMGGLVVRDGLYFVTRAESFLDSIPPNRSLMVNDLELPEDITVTPYVWVEPDESLTVRSDSILSDSVGEYEYDVGTVSTDSSMPLSRAMTDSEIDYGRYRRYKHRSFSDPWDHMRAAIDAFPPEYLASLKSFQTSSSDLTSDTSTYERVCRYDDELRLKMERFFEEECRVFTPDDPGLRVLEEALQSMDMKAIESDLDVVAP